MKPYWRLYFNIFFKDSEALLQAFINDTAIDVVSYSKVKIMDAGRFRKTFYVWLFWAFWTIIFKVSWNLTTSLQLGYNNWCWKLYENLPCKTIVRFILRVRLWQFLKVLWNLIARLHQCWEFYENLPQLTSKIYFYRF